MQFKPVLELVFMKARLESIKDAKNQTCTIFSLRFFKFRFYIKN